MENNAEDSKVVGKFQQADLQPLKESVHDNLVNDFMSVAPKQQVQAPWQTNLQQQEEFFRKPPEPVNNRPELLPQIHSSELLTGYQHPPAWISGADNVMLSGLGLYLSRRSAALSVPVLGTVGGISAYRDMRSLLNTDNNLDRAKYGLALGADSAILAGAGITAAKLMGGKFAASGVLISALGIGARAAVDLIQNKHN